MQSRLRGSESAQRPRLGTDGTATLNINVSLGGTFANGICERGALWEDAVGPRKFGERSQWLTVCCAVESKTSDSVQCVVSNDTAALMTTTPSGPSNKKGAEK